MMKFLILQKNLFQNLQTKKNILTYGYAKIIPNLKDKFFLIFIDADKKSYCL